MSYDDGRRSVRATDGGGGMQIKVGSGPRSPSPAQFSDLNSGGFSGGGRRVVMTGNEGGWGGGGEGSMTISTDFGRGGYSGGGGGRQVVVGGGAQHQHDKLNVNVYFNVVPFFGHGGVPKPLLMKAFVVECSRAFKANASKPDENGMPPVVLAVVGHNSPNAVAKLQAACMQNKVLTNIS